MGFSQSAATNFVPLLARLVLAAVFVPAGYQKVMTMAEYSGDDAKRLRELQVVQSDAASQFRFASLVQENAASTQSTSTSPSSTPSKPTTDETPRPPAGSGPAAQGGEPVKARQLYRVSLMVDKMGWQYPVVLGWVAALTELVGGALLFVGLLARVWALGLAVTMGVAFYLTSLSSYTGAIGFFRDFPINDYNRFAAQAALFALAVGVLLSGAGAPSFDRMMSRSGAAGRSGGNGAGAKKPSSE
ncbi:MAG: DoxX family protein [Phycisphaerales bacterium]